MRSVAGRGAPLSCCSRCSSAVSSSSALAWRAWRSFASMPTMSFLARSRAVKRSLTRPSSSADRVRRPWSVAALRMYFTSAAALSRILIAASSSTSMLVITSSIWIGTAVHPPERPRAGRRARAWRWLGLPRVFRADRRRQARAYRRAARRGGAFPARPALNGGSGAAALIGGRVLGLMLQAQHRLVEADAAAIFRGGDRITVGDHRLAAHDGRGGDVGFAEPGGEAGRGGALRPGRQSRQGRA